jgi:Arc/MetJ-type ribon-helix-helix transcriptional regulator
MAKQLAIRLSERELAAIDAAVARGAFPNRTAAIRAGVERVVHDERDHEIAEAYRRGYGVAPQEEWVGEAGAQLAGEAIAAADDR